MGEKALPFEIEGFEVDHSIYGATAYLLYGDTAIAYTGDIRLHGKKGDETRKFIKEARNASTLIIEGTRAGREEDINVSEREVYETALKPLKRLRGWL